MKTILTSILLFSFVIGAFSQIQIGEDIDGEATWDGSGRVSMPDANTIAIGASWNDGAADYGGHVRIYVRNGTTWEQKGSDIDGETAGDRFGDSVWMPDANTVAIGATENLGTDLNTGYVRIFSWDGEAWIQKGNVIQGEGHDDIFGKSVCMPDSNTVAIGAPWHGSSNIGYAQVYEWDGANWINKGMDIDGDYNHGWTGYSVSMPTADIIAVGTRNKDGIGNDAGHTIIYDWIDTQWVQRGLDINGEAMDDWSGYRVTMPDANTIGIGATKNGGNGPESGHVRVYIWNGIEWIQKGSDIDGEAEYNWSGRAISMPDPNTIAIGAPGNAGNGPQSGSTRVYKWNGLTWQQFGMDIDGEAMDDHSGGYVSMPDSVTVTIGAVGNDDNGTSAGHVRVYTFCSNTYSSLDVNAYCNYTVPSGDETYMVNGTYMDTIPTVLGCDSILTINLTLNDLVDTDLQSSCDSYTWIDGITYTSSTNTPEFALVSSAGCDSVVTLNLTINSVSDITTTLDDLTLTATNNNALYQWLDCNNNNAIISSETNQSFTPTENGNYAVELTENGCVSLSECTEIIVVGVLENSFDSDLLIYPNPSDGHYTLDFNQSFPNIQLDITDIRNKLIESHEYFNIRTLNLKLEQPAGIYLLKINSGNKSGVIKLIKE